MTVENNNKLAALTQRLLRLRSNGKNIKSQGVCQKLERQIRNLNKMMEF